MNAIKLAHRRKWTTLGSVLALICTGLGFVIYSKISESRARTLTVKYTEIESAYTNEILTFQEDMKLKGSKAEPDAQPNHSASTQKFAAFAKQNWNEPLGWQAAIRASTSLIEQKNNSEAIALLEPLVRKTLKNNFIQARVRRTLAGLYAESGEFDKSLAELNFIEKLPDVPSQNETKLFKARILYMSGKKDDAAKLLKELAGSSATDESDLSGKPASVEAALWIGYWGL